MASDPTASPANRWSSRPTWSRRGLRGYDLRRLRSRGLITRIPGTHLYQVTDHGLDTAKFFTAVHDRILPTGLAQITAPDPASSPLKVAATAYRRAVDTLTATTQFAA